MFGKEKGGKVYDAYGVLLGVGVLVWAIVAHRWWWTALAAGIIAVSFESLRREKARRESESSTRTPPTES